MVRSTRSVIRCGFKLLLISRNPSDRQPESRDCYDFNLMLVLIHDQSFLVREQVSQLDNPGKLGLYLLDLQQRH